MDSILAQRPNLLGGIRVGKADLQLAPYGPTYSDSDQKANPSTKFFRIGTLQPNSLKTSHSKEWYDYKAGLPKTDYLSYLVGQEGSLEAVLDEMTPYGIDIANGGYPRKYTTTSSTTIKTATVPTDSSFELTSATGYAAGNWIRVTVASSTKTWDAQILTLVGSVVTLVDPLPEIPAAGDAVVKITDVQNAIGGSKVTYYAARLVHADLNENNGIHVWYYPKVASRSELAPDFRDGENVILPVKFKIYGQRMTFDGNEDQFLGFHWHIPKA